MRNKTIVAIVSLTIIICFAMWQGVNGAIVSIGVSGIVGLGGFAIVKSKKANGKG